MERTTFNIFGKGELHCYNLMQGKTHSIIMVPTDDTWEYFYCYRVSNEAHEAQELKLLFGIVSIDEMNQDEFKN